MPDYSTYIQLDSLKYWLEEGSTFSSDVAMVQNIQMTFSCFSIEKNQIWLNV